MAIKNDPYRIYAGLSKEEKLFLQNEEKKFRKTYGANDRAPEFLYLKLELYILIQQRQALRKESQKVLENRKKSKNLAEKINPLILKMELILQEFNKKIGITHYPEKIYREKLRTFPKTSVEDSLDWIEKLEKVWPVFEKHAAFCFENDSESERKTSEKKMILFAQETFGY